MENILVESKQGIGVKSSDKIVEQRKEKLLNFFKNKTAWIYYLVLAIIVYLGMEDDAVPLCENKSCNWQTRFVGYNNQYMDSWT